MASRSARLSGAFASSAFTRFYLGQTLSYLGDGLRTIAIPLLVFRLTGSGVALGWTWGLELFPYAIVSLVGGSLADRVDRRGLMLVCDAARFAIMSLLALAFWTHRLNVGLVYVAVVLLAVAGAIFLGAQSTSIPYLLGKDGAKGGVAALVTAEQTVGIVAPPLGGALLGIIGPLPALIANALTYLCSQASIASVRSFGPNAPSGLPSVREIAADVREGWRFLMRDPALRRLSWNSCASNFVGTIGFVALIPFFKRAFGATDLAVGIAFGCFSVGMIAGALTAARTHWPVGRAITIGYALDGLFWLPLAWAGSMPLAVVLITLSSACSGYAMTAIVSWRMRVIPEPLVGRVFGVARLIVLAGILPGSILGGWLADHIGARVAVGVSAIGFFLVTLPLALSPAVRSETR